MVDPVLFKIFLSSPSDVPQERDDAQSIIDEINASGEFAHRYILKLYRWDDKTVVLPMPVTDIPQKSVDIYMIRPSACDLAIVLFWSRMGSPLVMDDREYLSGTHYEYSEALHGYQQVGKPTVWLYRCAEEPFISLKDPKRAEKNQQFDQVEQFFKQFQDSEGRYTGGVNDYPTHADFKALFRGQLLTYLRHVRDYPGSVEVPPKRSVDPNLIPYRGLTTLDEHDAPIFFGREAEMLELLSRIDHQRLVFVLGASGSGKSSLVAAGILPNLRERGWQIVRCVPGDDPFYAIALALVKLPEMGVPLLDALPAARKLANTLCESPAHLLSQIMLTLPGKRVLLFIDQFEELFALADKNPNLPVGSVNIFMQAIRQPSAYVTTLLTMRADFYGVALPYFDELKQQGYGLTQPSPFAMYEMITRPAELAGLKLDAGLAEQIVIDVSGESGGLALISYVLEAMYLRSKARGDGRLTVHDYSVELKGVRGAINTLADNAFADLPLDETIKTQALKTVFRDLIALTEEDGQLLPTRRRVSLANFPIGSDERSLIERFVQARLLVMDSQTVEVAHETIFRSWAQLKNWIAEAQEDLILLRQVRAASDEWIRKGKPDYLRWPAKRLESVYAMLGRLRVTTYLVDSELQFIEPEQTRLIADLGNIAIAHEHRRDIGDRLALIGDTRIGIGNQHGVPEIHWIPIDVPLSPVTFASVTTETEPIKLSPFFIAKYQITYPQYQAFVDAEDGFHNDQWWEGMPEVYKKQELKNQRTSLSNSPRDRVSWYQCVAFARWLTYQLNGLELEHSSADVVLHIGEKGNSVVRLPSEWEWQWVAQAGEKRRLYPWGDWQNGYANTSDSGLTRTTAVGMYPHGMAESGALDMVGNLSEWCQNDRNNYNVVDGYGNNEMKVLRGGSFGSNQDRANCRFRNYEYTPEKRSDYIGFRLVVGFPLTFQSESSET